MGYSCIVLPIAETRLMGLEDSEILDLIRAAGKGELHYASPDLPGQLEFPFPVDRTAPPVRLGKMASAVHYLLTGEFRTGPSPLSRAILGGRATRETLGFGPVNYLWSHEVREVSAALSSLTVDDLRSRYDPAAMKADSYATPINADDDEEEVFKELVGYVEQLVSSYRISAKRGDAMLIGTL